MQEKPNLDIQELPPPSRSRGGSSFKLMLVTVLALSLTGGGVYWVTRDDATREELKSRTLERLTDAVKDTPLGLVTKYLTPPPPPPPPSVTSPRTEPGTLAGQVIQSTLPAPVDGSGEGPAPEENVVPKVEEDSVVRTDFVQDMARWLASRYHPARGVNWSLSALNMRYGVKMHGLSPRGGEDLLAGRASVLRYAFNPTMLTALYTLYADRFVEELGHAAVEGREGGALTPEQTDAMYTAYAGRFEALGGVLHGIAALPDFKNRMDSMSKFGQQALNVHTQVTEAVFALDEAREAKNTTAMEAAQLRVNGLNAQYLRVIADRNTAQQALVSALRQAAPAARGVDEDTTLFVAGWVERRMGQDPASAQSALAASRLLNDLGGKLRKAGSITR